MTNKTLSLLLGLCLSLGLPMAGSAQTPCALSGTVDSIACDDNGTPNDSTDDRFTFLLSATGGTGTWRVDTLDFAYDTTFQFGPFPIAGGVLTLILTDSDTLSCADTVQVTPPAPCSVAPPCSSPITVTLSAIACDDNGTPLDSLDDTYTYKLLATGGTGTWSIQNDTLDFPYDSTFNFGPLLIKDGPLTLIVLDNDTLACTDTVMVTPPAPCSVPVCTAPISASFSMITCDDNGTSQDSLDDTFTLQLLATGGTGSWSLLPDSTKYLYDSSYVVGPFPISGGPLTLILTDNDNALCQDTVTVTPPAPCSVPTMACDVKEIGCIKFELLGITIDSASNRRYKIQVTNKCSNKLIYAAFQLPDGVEADDPWDNTTYVAPSGREYTVRNPNFSPFYSIRFKPVVDSISDGQSDVFEYTLPAQSEPTYIHTIVRVYPKIFYEAHLNTFNCMVVPTNVMKPKKLLPNVQAPPTKLDTIVHFQGPDTEQFTVYPNPTVDHVKVDLSDWAGQTVQFLFIDPMGKVLQLMSIDAETQPYHFSLPAGLDAGLYWIKIIPPTGKPKVRQVVLQW
ncbi:MAG: T9SS type A sorting domain-containing protein [Saprospiraceae bacterium]|nr:T9SS type A sorting domain-containing protein [Saprospiraceae bacterium]